MTESKTRTEKDSMGEMQVPADALYGASTARAVANFPIAHEPVPPAVIHAFGHLKAACAQANRDLGKLDAKLADAIIAASNEVAEGKHDAHFPVDIYQTGSGTSTNMNANEVIATLATRRLRLSDANADRVHPNDHVNMGQSSNDTFPTAMHIAAVESLRGSWTSATGCLLFELLRMVRDYDHIVKIGRTHLMDATPIRMGQVFKVYLNQLRNVGSYVDRAIDDLAASLPIGGTAVGTGINTAPDFGQRVCDELTARFQTSERTPAEQRPGFPLGESPLKFGIDGNVSSVEPDRVSLQSCKDVFVNAHGALKTYAVFLSKIANDIRHLGSGPRCGIFELMLPAIQPGSSIMPGKVNPVICESVMQVACRVIGNDAVVTTAGLGGVGSLFELNVAMPVMIDAFLESVKLLANVSNVLVDKLLAGLEVNEERCRELLDQSLMTVTSLAPALGYDTCAKLAKQAFEQGKTIRQLVKEQKLMDDATLEELLDPRSMTEPKAE